MFPGGAAAPRWRARGLPLRLALQGVVSLELVPQHALLSQRPRLGFGLLGDMWGGVQRRDAARVVHLGLDHAVEPKERRCARERCDTSNWSTDVMWRKVRNNILCSEAALASGCNPELAIMWSWKVWSSRPRPRTTCLTCRMARGPRCGQSGICSRGLTAMPRAHRNKLVRRRPPASRWSGASRGWRPAPVRFYLSHAATSVSAMLSALIHAPVSSPGAPENRSSPTEPRHNPFKGYCITSSPVGSPKDTKAGSETRHCAPREGASRSGSVALPPKIRARPPSAPGRN